MKYKKGFILICLIICLFSIASVCAGDVNETVVASEDQSDVVSIEETTDAISIEEADEVVSAEDNQVILKENDDIGNFTELSNLIENTPEGATLELNKNYKFVNGSKEGILINKTITIDGKGYALDGNNLSRILNVNASNVVLKNVIFVNGQIEDDHEGGAVYFRSSGTVENCNFINNTASKCGGAIYFENQGSVTNCNFTNNKETEINYDGGGAIYFNGNGNVTNCNFVNSTASYGGAIYVNSSNLNITDSQLTNNTARQGGAIYFKNKANMINMVNIANTSFINNIADNGAAVCKGAYDSNGTYLTITDSNFSENSGDAVISIDRGSTLNITGTTFINNEGTVILAISTCVIINDSDFTDNHGSFKGAIYTLNCSLTIINSHFTNNTAENGGAIYSTSNSILNIMNVAFINNEVSNCGGAISADKSCISITDCNFTNNTSDYTYGYGGAIYLESIPIISIKNTQFTNNSVLEYSASGGAIHMINCSNITIEKCNFSLNKVGFFGGAIYAVRLTNMKVIDSIFAQNTAGWYGGAICGNGNNFNIENTVFKNNNGTNGGAIFFDCSVYAPNSARVWVEDYDGYQHYVTAYRVDDAFGNNVKISNSIFESNIASQNVGGAIYSLANNLSIEDTSFIKNSASDGAAIYLDSSTTTKITGRTYDKESDGEYHYRTSYTTYSFGNNVKINNSIFESNIARNGGEAIIDQGVNTIIYNNINDTSIYASTIFVKCNDTIISNNKFDGGKTSIQNNTNTTDDNTTDTNNTNTTDGNKTDATNTTIEPEITIPSLNQPSNDGSVEISLPLDATGTITLTINNEDYQFTVVDGVAEVILPDLGDGNYSYTIKYSGDDKYSSFTNEGNLKVNKTIINPANNESDINTTENNDTNLSQSIGFDIGFFDDYHIYGETNILGFLMPKDIEGSPIVLIDGKEYLCSNPIDSMDPYSWVWGGDSQNNGYYVYFSDLKPGNHEVIISYPGDSKYDSCSINKTITVYDGLEENSTKPAPEVVVPPMDKPSEDGAVTISLPADATGTVTLTVDGNDYVFDVVGGKADVKLPELGNGDYNYIITYSGDSKYASVTSQGSMNVNKTSENPTDNTTVDLTKITVSNLKVTYSAGKYCTIKVVGADGNAASGVAVELSGKISKTLTTNADGIAKFKVTQKPGLYKISITSLGITVNKKLTVKHLLTLKTIKVKKSAKKLTLQATLGKLNKKYLKNKKITFKFNGKKYTAKTNKKGVAKVTIKSKVLKKLKVGKKVTYQATYLKDTVKKSVKVKK